MGRMLNFLFGTPSTEATPAVEVELSEHTGLPMEGASLESVLTAYVKAGYVLSYRGPYSSYELVPNRQDRSEDDAMYAERITRSNLANVRHNVDAAHQRLHNQLADEALIRNVAQTVVTEKLQAAKFRTMIKMVNAGLDKSDAFLKVVEATELGTVASVDRWVERSNAYQAYLTGNVITKEELLVVAR